MKRLILAASALCLGQMILAETAGAWVSADRWGGSTSHSWGAGGTTHTNAWGGSTSHSWAGGTTHTNTYGGTTSGAFGAGATHTYADGTTAYRPPAYGGYPAYHPPVAVPYAAPGCYGCAAAAGAVVGVAAGAAMASAANASANANAYAAGVAAGASYAMGGQYASLPGGCVMPAVGGKTYYICGNTWFLPSYGANGVYYRVVPAP